MTPKTREVALVMRNRIIELHKNGKSYREIGKAIQLPFTTVGYIVRKYEELGSIENKPRPGRLNKLTMRVKRSVVKTALKNPMVSAQKIVEDIATSSNIIVTPQTIRNVLHNAGLKGRTPRRKPFISETNRRKRLEFALAYRNKPMDFWKTVIFSDESKFEIFSPPSIRKIWRKNKTALDPKHILQTVKHGGGNVMVWGCMASNGVGNLDFIDTKMTASTYIDVLRNNLLSSARKLGLEQTFHFQQDNDPKHTAIVTRTWLLTMLDGVW